MREEILSVFENIPHYARWTTHHNYIEVLSTPRRYRPGRVVYGDKFDARLWADAHTVRTCLRNTYSDEFVKALDELYKDKGNAVTLSDIEQAVFPSRQKFFPEVGDIGSQCTHEQVMWELYSYMKGWLRVWVVYNLKGRVKGRVKLYHCPGDMWIAHKSYGECEELADRMYEDGIHVYVDTLRDIGTNIGLCPEIPTMFAVAERDVYEFFYQNELSYHVPNSPIMYRIWLRVYDSCVLRDIERKYLVGHLTGHGDELLRHMMTYKIPDALPSIMKEYYVEFDPKKEYPVQPVYKAPTSYMPIRVYCVDESGMITTPKHADCIAFEKKYLRYNP